VPIVSSSGTSGYHSEAKVTGPGVVTGRYGTLGEVFYVEDDFWPLNTTLYVQDFKGNDPRFVSYFLRTLDFASQNAAGAVPGVNRNALHLLEVTYPVLHVQRRIANILSAYDDLIDNNTRRIAILEEMARAIYHEWFVHFRFPGHEQVEMVESELGPVPAGWEVRRLGEEITLSYGKALKAGDRRDGTIPVYGSSGIIGYNDDAFVDGPGIIVGRKGNVGSVHWCDDDFFPIDTTYYVETNVDLHYVYFNLREQHFINNDAAVPGLNRNQAYSLPLLIPSSDVLDRFKRVITLLFGQERNLRRRNQVLRQTRDLLLPRLITGDIEVTAAEDALAGVAA
jgi:type I restriction enzyme S subunit